VIHGLLALSQHGQLIVVFLFGCEVASLHGPHEILEVSELLIDGFDVSLASEHKLDWNRGAWAAIGELILRNLNWDLDVQLVLLGPNHFHAQRAEQTLSFLEVILEQSVDAVLSARSIVVILAEGYLTKQVNLSKGKAIYSRAREASFWVPKCAKLELMASAMPLLKAFAMLSLAERPLINQTIATTNIPIHINS